MSASVLNFDVFAGSARGLLARPVMPNNQVAYLANISTIGYEVHNLTDGGMVSGSLTPADVMFAALQTPWTPDKTGYTVKWQAPGTLWSLPNKSYRIVVTFTTTTGLQFVLVWQANTKNPAL